MSFSLSKKCQEWSALTALMEEIQRYDSLRKTYGYGSNGVDYDGGNTRSARDRKCRGTSRRWKQTAVAGFGKTARNAKVVLSKSAGTSRGVSKEWRKIENLNCLFEKVSAKIIQ